MGKYYCFECDEDITEEEYRFSKKRFKKALCRDCQPNKNAKVKTVVKAVFNNKRGGYKKNVKKCMKCGSSVHNDKHDFCYDCFLDIEDNEEGHCSEDSFKEDLFNDKIYTVYVMFYGNKEKVGFTEALNSRMLEIKRKFPDNKLVYFREFVKESDARRFEAWLKGLPNRNLMKFVSGFQDKIRKVDTSYC